MRGCAFGVQYSGRVEQLIALVSCSYSVGALA